MGFCLEMRFLWTKKEKEKLFLTAEKRTKVTTVKELNSFYQVWD